MGRAGKFTKPQVGPGSHQELIDLLYDLYLRAVPAARPVAVVRPGRTGLRSGPSAQRTQPANAPPRAGDHGTGTPTQGE
jgi:hypothetical protein